MRIDFERQGGFGYFPGRRVAGSIETDTLAPADARALEDLVRAAGVLSHPPPPRPALPDARTYVIEVRDGDRHRRVEVSEPVEDQALADLVAELQRRVRGRSPGR